MTMPIPGLKHTTGNVFRYSDQGGARVRDNQPLYWGQAYYVVWNNHLRNDFPSGIIHRQLIDYFSWKCAEIEFPASLDNAVALWAGQFLEKRVERPPVSLALVTPTIMRYTEDDALIIADDAEVIIAVVGQPGARITENLSVRLPGSESCYALSMPEEPPLLLSLGRLPLGLTTIFFPRHTETSLRLVVQSSPVPIHVRAVELVFRDVTTQQNESLSAFCPLASSALQNVQRGLKELVEIKLPTIVPFHLLTRKTNSSIWKDSSFLPYVKDTGKTFGDRICQAINDALILKNTFITLDFGNYGQPSTASASYCLPQFQQLTLPAGLRKRLEWILSLADTNFNHSGASTGTLRRLQHQFCRSKVFSVDLQSKQLIQRLRRTRALPDSIEPHLRTIDREIRQWLGN
jgi:hypothetical protein